MFPQAFIDDLRMHADIVQVIQEYVTAQEVGRHLQRPVPVPFGKDARRFT